MNLELLGQIKDVLDNEERAQTEDTRRENYLILYKDRSVDEMPSVKDVIMALIQGHKVKVVDKTLGDTK